MPGTFISGVKSGIQRRIVKTMLVIGIIPLIAGLYLTYLDGTRTLKKTIGSNFQEIAKETGNKIDLIIKKEIVELKRLAVSPYVFNAINSGEGRSVLIDYLKKFASFDEKDVHSILVVDSRGKFIAGINEPIQDDYSNETWFKGVFANGKVYVGDMKYYGAKGVYLMNIATPVILKGRYMGVVVIRYNLDNLFDVVNNVRIEETGHATLADSKGSILMCPIYPPLSHQVNRPLLNLISSTKPGWAVADDDAHGGKKSIIGFAPVGSSLNIENDWFDGNRWYVFIRQSPGEMYAPIYYLMVRVSVFGLLLIAVLALTGVVAARNIVRPIRELHKGVGQIVEGKLDYRLNIRTDDEIGELAEEFNRMAEELNRTYTTLEQRNKEIETSEARYKDLVENSPEMIHSVNADRYFIDVNKTELDILGYTLIEMHNMRLEDIVPKELKHKVVQHIKKAIKNGKGIVETQFIAKDGRILDAEISATALYHPVTFEFVKTRAFVRDITDRKNLERHIKEYYEILEKEVNDRTRELKETKDYLENLLETANDVIYTLNPQGIIKYVNKKVEDWGYRKDELIGNSFLMMLSGKYKTDRFKMMVLKGDQETYEVEVLNKFGEIKDTVLSVSPLRGNDGTVAEILCIANDITEQKKLEHQVAQAEKMSNIGQLAAGIAHEINNPIGGVLNCLYNIKKGTLPPEREGEYLKYMEDGIRRVQRTIEQLLDFSQQHEPELKAVNINSLLDGVLSLIGYVFSKNHIVLSKEFSNDLPLLMIDQHKIGQVLMNILLNAVQAIKDKGAITVRTFRDEGWCIIEIRDNGIGIPPHILPKIFDPFFTTKDVGKGTGLGLAVSRGIVEKHAGRIEVKSNPGAGSSFIIKLPVRSSLLSKDRKTSGFINDRYSAVNPRQMV